MAIMTWRPAWAIKETVPLKQNTTKAKQSLLNHKLKLKPQTLVIPCRSLVELILFPDFFPTRPWALIRKETRYKHLTIIQARGFTQRPKWLTTASFGFLFVFETVSCSLEFLILLPLPSKCWNYRHESMSHHALLPASGFHTDGKPSSGAWNASCLLQFFVLTRVQTPMEARKTIQACYAKPLYTYHFTVFLFYFLSLVTKLSLHSDGVGELFNF